MAVSKKLRVLVVDDSKAYLEECARIIAEIPDVEIVATAANGAEAIRATKNEKPDLILMDIIMPDIDGLVALRMLCRGIPGTRVAIISSLAKTQQEQEAFRQGAIAVIGKPIDRRSLEALFEKERIHRDEVRKGRD